MGLELIMPVTPWPIFRFHGVMVRCAAELVCVTFRKDQCMNDDEADYTKLPDDFPRPISFGAVPGTQPKFLATTYEGKFYLVGCSPPELYERWQMCEEIAHDLAIKSRDSMVGKHSAINEGAILERYFLRLLQANWTSEAETRWIIQRAAQILNWPVPPSASASEKS